MKISLGPGLILAAFCVALAGCGPAPVTNELFYDNSNDVVIDGFGNYSSPLTVECCVIFDTVKLANYVGGKIVSVKLFNPSGLGVYYYTPQVFAADDGVNPPTLVSANAAATPIAIRSWQIITLDAPVTIQAAKVYWVGYKILTVGLGDFPLAAGVEGDYGNNRLRTGGGSGGFGSNTYNWMIRMMVRK